jgi:predicted nucleic acid-binding protein
MLAARTLHARTIQTLSSHCEVDLIDRCWGLSLLVEDRLTTRRVSEYKLVSQLAGRIEAILTVELLAVHPLRAADAFQLAAALHWCQRQATNNELVSFDTRLRQAGYTEGFTLLPAELH